MLKENGLVNGIMKMTKIQLNIVENGFYKKIKIHKWIKLRKIIKKIQNRIKIKNIKKKKINELKRKDILYEINLNLLLLFYRNIIQFYLFS